MKRLSFVVPVLGVVVLTGAMAAAQQPPAAGAPAQGRGGQNQEPPKNLQVLPKDTPRPQVVQTMQAFTAALGVQCAYCHIDEGRGGRQDYAADEKPTKKTARQMIVLARDINDKLPAAVSKAADATARVGCVTCHRGVAIPKQIADILGDTAKEKGTPAAIAQYRELRQKYLGTMAYDFSEAGLIRIAQQASQAMPDDAVQLLQLNLEFYPKSARSYVAIAQIQNRKGDKDAAIKSLEKALEADPASNQAKQMLSQLKGGL